MLADDPPVFESGDLARPHVHLQGVGSRVWVWLGEGWPLISSELCIWLRVSPVLESGDVAHPPVHLQGVGCRSHTSQTRNGSNAPLTTLAGHKAAGCRVSGLPVGSVQFSIEEQVLSRSVERL